MADLLITVSDVTRAFDCFNFHKDAGPEELFSKVLKALRLRIAHLHTQMFNLSLQTDQAPDDGRCIIVTPAEQNTQATGRRQLRQFK